MVFNSQETLNPEKIYDVVIVGSGPIGLATAVGLYKRGIQNILVLDQTRTFRPIGKGLDLLPNGLKSLKYLDINAYTTVKEFVISLSPQKSLNSSRSWCSRNLQGKLTLSIPLSFDDWVEKYGEGRLSIPWYELQTILRNLLPSNLIKANHRCINVINEPEFNCVRIDCVSDTSIAANPYAHWENNQTPDQNLPQNLDKIPPILATTSFRAKLIIGADGINSTVRQKIYENTPNAPFAKPEYSGFAAISCRGITNIPQEIQTEIETRFLQNSIVVNICGYDPTSANSQFNQRLRMILFCINDQFAYILHLPLPLESLQGKIEHDLLKLAQQELEKAGFPESLKQFVNLSPVANMEQRPYYINRVVHQSHNTTIQPTWYQQRIVLTGGQDS